MSSSSAMGRIYMTLTTPLNKEKKLTKSERHCEDGDRLRNMGGAIPKYKPVFDNLSANTFV